MVSSIILREVRQPVVSSYRVPSGLLFRPAITSTPVTIPSTQFRQTTSFGTSRLLMTRSIVPYRFPVTSTSMVSGFINVKEFHVHISRDDSGPSLMATVKRHLRNAMNPFCWPYLRFTLDEDYTPDVDVGSIKPLFSVPKKKFINEGTSFIMRNIDDLRCHNLKVLVEDNIMIWEGLGGAGKTQTVYTKSTNKTTQLSETFKEIIYLKFVLPKKTYQSSDVKATFKDGVLSVTFSNLTRVDFGFKLTPVTICSRNEHEELDFS